jgi:hypothetical protein
VSPLNRPKSNSRNEQSERDGVKDSFQGEAGASISTDSKNQKGIDWIASGLCEITKLCGFKESAWRRHN